MLAPGAEERDREVPRRVPLLARQAGGPAPIAELEQRSRGPYTGGFAYFNRDGSGDSNMLIRTISIEGDRVAVRAGAGIVADSRPERELEETRQKARGPLAALSGLLA